MSEIEKTISSLVLQSNQYFNAKQFEEAAVKAEKAYSIASHYDECPSLAKRKLEYNLACIYTAAKNYELAKGWLDRLDGDSSIFPRRKELAVLYTQIANALRRQNKLKPAIECLKLAGEYYARCQMWHDFCLVNLTRAQLLIDAGYVERSLSVANKILAASFNLDYDPIAVAKIFNDLSTIFAIDPYGLENIRYSRKLLKKALRIVQENQRADLEIFVYLNLAAISNQLENFDSALRYLELAYTLNDSQSNSQNNQQYHLLSDLKFNEGYASFKVDRMNDAIDAFSKSHNFALKTNQNNIWESLECLACVYSQLEDFDKAAVNILKAVEFYASYCERKNLEGDEKIRSRLDSKSKQIERHAKTIITSRPSLKELTNNDQVYEDGLNDERNNNNNHDNNNSSNNEEPIETREIFEDEEEKNEKEEEVESSRRSNNGSKLSSPSEEAHSDRASILEQMRHDENAQETDADNKEDDEEEEEKRNEDDDDDVVEGNETLIANHESMKRLIQDLKFHNQAKAEEESDHDEVRMFKEQIIELNTTKKENGDNPREVNEKKSKSNHNSQEENREIEEENNDKNNKNDNNHDTTTDEEGNLITTIKTNDSGDIVIGKMKRSEVINEPEPDQPFVLHPRNSLDPESSLKRDIDEYVRVMERQEQMLEQQQQQQPRKSSTDNRRNSRQVEEIQEMVVERREENKSKHDEQVAQRGQEPVPVESKKKTKICVIS